jgi:hypothetical protein
MSVEQEQNAETTAPKQRKVVGKPFPKGVSGNPKGRPKGSLSIKDAVRQHLEANPTDFQEFVAHFIKDNRELAWQMLEGRPSQDVGIAAEITTRAELTDEQLERIIRQRASKLTSGEGGQTTV